MSKKVSIIITAYNYVQYLSFAIDSALNQNYDNLEVIVVNDGSTDNTDEVCKSYGDKIRYIYQENQGLVGARRTGIDASSGEYIMCLDADDEIDPEYVSECAKLLDAGYSIACSNWIEFQDDPTKGPDYIHNINVEHLTFKDFYVANRIIAAAMFTREIYNIVGGYDSYMKFGYEDFELWTNMVKHGAKIGVVQKILYFYRKHGISMIDTAKSKHTFLLNYIQEKHKDGLI